MSDKKLKLFNEMSRKGILPTPVAEDLLFVKGAPVVDRHNLLEKLNAEEDEDEDEEYKLNSHEEAEDTNDEDFD